MCPSLPSYKALLPVKVRIFLTAVLAAATTLLAAQSQNYRHFEWDLLRIGYTAPQSDYYRAGIAGGTEIRYNATDNLSVGLRGELAFYSSDLDGQNIDIGAATSTLITGDYYLKSSGGFRPFGGVGIGFFTGARAVISDRNFTEPTNYSGGRSLGLTPRLGMELGHFRVSVEYNYTFRSRVTDYLTIIIAPTLFGGPKDRTDQPLIRQL